MSVVIKAENISKQYRLGEVGTGSLKDDFKRWRYQLMGKEDPFLTVGEENDRTKKSNTDYVWALKNISFRVNQGDVLGVVGKNGAGKSTLLKILSRTTGPTTGSLKMKGRVASLLEVGTGFHGELSGRENIFLNGAIMGMSKTEIRNKLEEIIEFAGVEKYIDTPVKRYSSGMYVRLAFGVAAHLEPEILIVDEVLAVGDAEFQKKAIGKMKDISAGGGRTVLFVSHNLNAVRNLCTSGILIENGKLVLQAPISSVLDQYMSSAATKTRWEGLDGDRNVSIMETYISTKKSTNKFFTSDSLEVGINIKVHYKLKDIVIGFNLKSSDSTPILRSLYNDFNELTEIEAGEYIVTFNIPPYFLARGNYKISFDVALPFVKKISTEKIDLEFEVESKSILGNRYLVENSPIYNSIIRPNLFSSIDKV